MGTVAFIDSGIGGITTLLECRKLLPDADFVYFADDLYAPYGDKSAEYIYERQKDIIKSLRKYCPVAFVLACNTATAACIDRLRKESDIPIIGTEPALAPAARATDGKILVLTTPRTAAEPRFTTLLNKTAGNFDIMTIPELATLIEKNVENVVFMEKSCNILLENKKNCGYRAAVLGCTHYIFVKRIISEILGCPCYDGNFGIAKRLASVVSNTGTGKTELLVTDKFNYGKYSRLLARANA